MNKSLLFGGTVFLGIVLVYITATYILGDMSRYVEIKKRWELQKSLQGDIQENFVDMQMRFVDYKKFEGYLQNFTMNEDRLKNLLQRFFTVEVMEHIHRRKEKKVIVDRYVVSTLIETPRDFFAFIEYILKQHYPIKVLMPIDFQKRGKINLSFELDLYTLQSSPNRSRQNANRNE